MKAFERYRLHVATDSADANRGSVVVAFIANILVAIAKTFAAMMTLSPSLRAEAAHSWVDSINEVFVLAAERTGARGADEEHPLGYGRASYVWSMFASLGMLAVGAVVGVYQGIGQLGQPESTSRFAIGYLVIAVSAVLEGWSFLQTMRIVRAGAVELGRDLFEHAFRSSNSPLRAVFTEDFTALVALVIAALGMALHQVTGNGDFDAIGSIVIGVLMGAAALMLIGRNSRFLAGASLSIGGQKRVVRILKAFAEIRRVTFLYTEFIGPDRLLVLAGVELVGTHAQDDLARLLRTLEQRVMQDKYVGLALLTLATPEDNDIVCD